MVDYKSSELDIIRKKRKPDESKPSYYNSYTDQNITISGDFESYLILQKISSKQQLLQALRRNIKDNTNYTDRDAILSTALTNILTNADKIVSELDVETGNFSEFKDSLMDEDRRFDDLVELNRMITVMNTPIEELSFHRDQAFQDGNVAMILQDRIAVKKSDDKTKKELETWQKVVSSYEGTK